MFGKHFACTYTGSMYGSGVTVFAVWGYAIANKDTSGRVELNPRLLAAVLGADEAEIRAAIARLCEPDTESRRSDFEGRRMIHEGGFQYFLTGAAHYTAIKHPEDMREYNREAQRRSRERRRQATSQNVKSDVKKSNAKSSMSPHEDLDKDVDKTNTSPKRAPRASGDAHFDRFWSAYPKKENKPGTLKAWKKAKPDPDAVIAGVEAWRKSERWAKGYIVAPAKFLTERRWEDAPQAAYHGSTEVAL